MMRIVTVLFAACCLFFSASAFGMYVPGFDNSQSQTVELKGQFIVQFTDNVDLKGVTKGFGMFRLGVSSIDETFDRFEAKSVRPIAPAELGKSTPLSRVYVVEIPEDQSDDDFKQTMLANPYVQTIENDVACMVRLSPNDPSHNSQWAYKAGSQVMVHEGWDIETGSDSIVIAIIDSGVLYTHNDLKNNIWVNPGEDIDGDQVVFDSTDIDGVDNDANGYTDDLVGYDFLQSIGSGISPWPGEDSSIKDNDPKDFNGHGTHCAGIAAAVTNNAYGVCGMSGGWGTYSSRGARIMCLRAGYSAVHPDFGYETGYLVMSAVVEAINYAVNNGADVISYSAGSSSVTGMATALNAAMNAGIVFCEAAGNDGNSSPDYFGIYSGILSVAATDYTDHKASFSNYGSWVEISAPGVGIYSTYSNHYSATYASLDGTSMACPMTAGLAALVKSHYPQYTKFVIDTMLMNNADNIDAANPSYVGLLGSGRINAYNCLSSAPVAKFSGTPTTGHTPLEVTFSNESPAATNWDWTFGDGGNSSSSNPVHTYNTPGLYTVTLEVTDPNGIDTEVKKSYIFADADTMYSTVTSGTSGVSFEVPISLKNTINVDQFYLVLSYPGLTYNSYNVVGTRCENFDLIQVKAQTTDKIAMLFTAAQTTASDPLPPGDGPIVNFWFTSASGTAVTIDTTNLSGYSTKMISIYTDYVPAIAPMEITFGMRGDANNDGVINVGDAVYIINYIFKGGSAPTEYAGDANGDGVINVGDAVYIINYIFKSGPPPPP